MHFLYKTIQIVSIQGIKGHETIVHLMWRKIVPFKGVAHMNAS